MKLLDKLNVREEFYENHTVDIFAELGNLLAAADRLLGDHITQKLQWVDVLLLDEILMIVGATYYTTMTVQGEEEVEDVIRIGVPFDLAETGTVSEIISFIQAQSTEIPELKEYTKDPNEPIFDLNELSDEQKILLAQHSPAKKSDIKH